MMASIAADESPPPHDGALDDLTAVYRGHYRSLVRLASLLVGDVGVCEEIVQDAFVRTFQQPPRLREGDRLPAYLRSAVLNGARSHLRHRLVRRRHLIAVPEPAPGADHSAMASVETDRVLAALRSLPARQREVLVLRYYLDLSEADIAATLGIAPGSVKTHAHRGLATLGDRLEATP